MERFRYWLIVGCFVCSPALAQQPARTAPDLYTYKTSPMVEITDRELIDFLLFELFIQPQSSDVPTKMEVIDVTSNGYGPNDIIVVYPSQEVFAVQAPVPAVAQEVMSTWAPDEQQEFRYFAGNAPVEVFNPANDTLNVSADQAQRAITYDLLRSLERNYNDTPISVLLERTDEGFSMRMWGYEGNDMAYEPPPVATRQDTIVTRDVLGVVRADSILYDLLYIYTTVEETEVRPDTTATASAETTGAVSTPLGESGQND